MTFVKHSPLPIQCPFLTFARSLSRDYSDLVSALNVPIVVGLIIGQQYGNSLHNANTNFSNRELRCHEHETTHPTVQFGEA